MNKVKKPPVLEYDFKEYINKTIIKKSFDTIKYIAEKESLNIEWDNLEIIHEFHKIFKTPITRYIYEGKELCAVYQRNLERTQFLISSPFLQTPPQKTDHE